MRMTAQELKERTFEFGIRVVRAVDFCPEATLLEKLDSNCWRRDSRRRKLSRSGTRQVAS